MTEKFTDLITGKPLEPWAEQAMETRSGRHSIESSALAEALDKAILFTAYRASDPLAIRFEFANDEDRLRAANAIDAALSTHPTPTEQGGEIEAIRDLLAKYQRFASETAGKCLGLAMSTEHPAPDEVLMGIFEASQALAAEARATLTKSNGDPA